MKHHLYLFFAGLTTALLFTVSVVLAASAYVVIEEITLPQPASSASGNWLDFSSDGRIVTYKPEAGIAVFDRSKNVNKIIAADTETSWVAYPFVSDNGRFTTYLEYSKHNPETYFSEIRGYVYDTKTEQHENIMFGQNGEPLIQIWESLYIWDVSPDGRYIVYSGSVANPFDGQSLDTCVLFNSETNICSAVFLFDLVTKQTERISVNNAGQIANGHSFGEW
jgi:hypothetical protein